MYTIVFAVTTAPERVNATVEPSPEKVLTTFKKAVGALDTQSVPLLVSTLPEVEGAMLWKFPLELSVTAP